MNDLIDRYLWAVSRHLPASVRTDVTDELRGTIADTVDARSTGDADAATREVLLELGDPEALARSYEAHPRYLIGPAVFDDFKRVVTAILVVVLPLVLVVMTVVNIGIEDESLPAAFLHAAVSTGMVGIQVVFWTGLVFVIIERTGADPGGETTSGAEAWDPDQLAPLPPVRQIGVPELLWGLGVAAVAIGWLPYQHVRGFVDDDEGNAVPLLDPELWSGWIPAFIALMLAAAVLEILKFRAGRWTLPLTVANAFLDAVLAAYFVVVFTRVGVENPDFAAAMAEHGDVWEPGVIGPVVLALILAVLVWDAVDGVRQHRSLADTGTRGPAPREELAQSGAGNGRP